MTLPSPGRAKAASHFPKGSTETQADREVRLLRDALPPARSTRARQLVLAAKATKKMSDPAPYVKHGATLLSHPPPTMGANNQIGEADSPNT